jgi:exoribonuclease-2
MSDTPGPNSLVLYKSRPALVIRSGDKLEIELEGGKQLKVRPKDVALLHPGPLRSLHDLESQSGKLQPSGEVEIVWELLAGSQTTLPELAELIYDAYTPASAWITWQLVEEGLYFQGGLDTVFAATAEQVQQVKAGRAAKAAREQAWLEFIQRARAGQLQPQDENYLQDVAAVAYGRYSNSKLLRELGRAETPESAHAWLLDIGYWDETVDPYPARLGLNLASSAAPLAEFPAEDRLDLTHLPAFAVDDEGSQDPDDALSVEGRRLWVHVADVAALAPSGSPADLEARARGATLYLPERTVTMLPPQATLRLALGLSDLSPALSFGLDLDKAGHIAHLDLVPSWVKVQRLSYEEAETRLTEPPLAGLHRIAQTLAARRRARGEIAIDLPEVKLRVINGKVELKPILPLRSRNLVREAMLIAGEAAARFAIERNLPLPFTIQASPELPAFPDTLSGHFARRMSLARSQLSGLPGPHAGLGLEVYAKATSPLRRYSDLVVHQQLRAALRGEPPLEAGQVLERVGAAEAGESDTRRAERLARRHWTLVYLRQNPDWRGAGVIVEKRGPRDLVLIPELDLETQLALRGNLPLDSEISLTLSRVNLPELEVYFRTER